MKLVVCSAMSESSSNCHKLWLTLHLWAEQNLFIAGLIIHKYWSVLDSLWTHKLDELQVLQAPAHDLSHALLFLSESKLLPWFELIDDLDKQKSSVYIFQIVILYSNVMCETERLYTIFNSSSTICSL